MEEKKAWIAQNTKVAIGSDAFFPFGDNIDSAYKSGIEFIAQAGASVRDDNVIETCDKYGIAMAKPNTVSSVPTATRNKRQEFAYLMGTVMTKTASFRIFRIQFQRASLGNLSAVC